MSGKVDIPIQYYELLNKWHNGDYAFFPVGIGTDASGSHFLTQEYVHDKRGKPVLDRKTKQPIILNRSYVVSNLSSVVTSNLPLVNVLDSSYVIYNDTDGQVKALNGATLIIDYKNIDASTTIQQAVNGLTAGRTYEQRVTIKGTYTIQSTITIPSYTHLDCRDAYFTAGNSLNGSMFSGSAVTNIDIEGGIYNGGGLTTNAPLIAFTDVAGISYYHHINIKGVIMRNFKNRGIWYIYIVRGRIEDSHLGDYYAISYGDLIRLTNCQEIKVTRCLLENSTDSYGMVIDGGGNHDIISVHSQANALAGLGLINSTHDAHITGCQIVNNSRTGSNLYADLEIESGTYKCSIAGSTFGNEGTPQNVRHGIRLASGTADNVIVGNGMFATVSIPISDSGTRTVQGKNSLSTTTTTYSGVLGIEQWNYSGASPYVYTNTGSVPVYLYITANSGLTQFAGLTKNSVVIWTGSNVNGGGPMCYLEPGESVSQVFYGGAITVSADRK